MRLYSVQTTRTLKSQLFLVRRFARAEAGDCVVLEINREEGRKSESGRCALMWINYAYVIDPAHDLTIDSSSDFLALFVMFTDGSVEDSVPMGVATSMGR